MSMIYKSFSDLATAIGPVMPSTKEIVAEYGPAIDSIPPQAPEGPRVFKRYVLPEESPEDYTDEFWRKLKAEQANLFVALCSTLDMDERSQFDPIQLMDKLAQGIERMRDTAEDAGHQTKEEIAAFDRLDSGTEIDIERYRRLQERLRLLRLKWFKANKLFEAAMLARTRLVSQSGMKHVDEYMSLERLAGQRRLKVERERRDFAAMKAAEKLLGMSEKQFREHQSRTRQRLLDTTLGNMANGIDADDGKGAGLSKISGRPSPSEAVA
jgi:hypothetical protein